LRRLRQHGMPKEYSTQQKPKAQKENETIKRKR
jgi:hypothetical protein